MMRVLMAELVVADLRVFSQPAAIQLGVRRRDRKLLHCDVEIAVALKTIHAYQRHEFLHLVMARAPRVAAIGVPAQLPSPQNLRAAGEVLDVRKVGAAWERSFDPPAERLPVGARRVGLIQDFIDLLVRTSDSIFEQLHNCLDVRRVLLSSEIRDAHASHREFFGTGARRPTRI